MKELDLLQFFKDIEFMPPGGRDPSEFVNNVTNSNVSEFCQDSIFSNIYNSHNDHPDPQTYSDYYMFTDPVTRGGSLTPVKSEIADTLNTDYKIHDSKEAHSFSDVHLESLEQATGEFPKHKPTGRAVNTIINENPEESSFPKKGLITGTPREEHETQGPLPKRTGIRSTVADSQLGER